MRHQALFPAVQDRKLNAFRPPPTVEIPLIMDASSPVRAINAKEPR